MNAFDTARALSNYLELAPGEKALAGHSMGNETANLGNKTFVLGLLELLLHDGGLDMQGGLGFGEGLEDDFGMVSASELEIIPVTVRITGMVRNGIPENQELPAIMWKSK